MNYYTDLTYNNSDRTMPLTRQFAQEGSSARSIAIERVPTETFSRIHGRTEGVLSGRKRLGPVARIVIERLRVSTKLAGLFISLQFQSS